MSGVIGTFYHLRAYDADHTLLAEAIVNLDLLSEVMCVAAPGIHTVEFSGYHDEFVWFDDMQVSFAPVAVATATWGGIKARVGGSKGGTRT